MSFSEQIPLIMALHADSIERWKKEGVQLVQDDFFALVEQNHAFNYQLWHSEDRARRDDMGFEFVYQAKREIDHFNQQRNNQMEAMDEYLYRLLKPSAPHHCPVHSETPGMMIDRLSILSLKAYHMHAQTLRQNVDDAHRQSCLQKSVVIQEQQKQLQFCLQQLVTEVEEGTRTFRLYHQFKMYNDAKLNPELYA